ncbi:MAG: glucose-6-phosphate isomerase, partial [Cellvibrionaceae bacterium]
MENISTALQAQSEKLKELSLLELFKQNPKRANKFCLNVGGLEFDYAKNHIDQETLNYLQQFANQKNMKNSIAALLDGEEINNTEKRPALHSALREPKSHTTTSLLVQQTLDKVSGFVESIHQHQWLGHSGKPISTVVNIGIGGSDLGPRMVAQALSTYHVPQTKVYFVANIDGADLEDTLVDLDPETTLFIVASKTFTTLETLNNASSARQWILDSG